MGKATTVTTIRILAVTAVGMIVSCLSIGKAYAANFNFIKIADADNFGNLSVSSPAINDWGTVAFKVSNFSEGSEVPFTGGIFTGSGGTFTTIAPIGTFFSVGGTVDINNNGIVTFQARTMSVGGDEILTGSGGALTIIADTNRSFSNLDFPTINDEGTVAFNGQQRTGVEGIFTSSGGLVTTIADTSGSFNSSGISAINNSGTITFNARPDKVGGEGIFTASQGTLTAIVDSSGPFNSFRNPGINDKGTVIFSAGLDTRGEGIFTATEETLTRIVDSSGSFESFLDQPAINNKGVVVFLATLDIGGIGIFTGSDLIADKVIATGDILFGSKITGLNFTSNGLNNRGEIAFAAAFEDRTEGYFVAVPVVNVPEPNNLLGMGAAMGLGAFFKRKLSKKQKSKGMAEI